MDMMKQVGRDQMCVGWYHSHPGFGPWLSGTDAAAPGGHLLRQVRNTYGPRWLRSVTLADLAPALPA